MWTPYVLRLTPQGWRREGWVSVFKMSGLWIFYYVLILESEVFVGQCSGCLVSQIFEGRYFNVWVWHTGICFQGKRSLNSWGSVPCKSVVLGIFFKVLGLNSTNLGFAWAWGLESCIQGIWSLTLWALNFQSQVLGRGWGWAIVRYVKTLNFPHLFLKVLAWGYWGRCSGFVVSNLFFGCGGSASPCAGFL